MKNGVQRTWVQSPPKMRTNLGMVFLSCNFNFTSEVGRGEGNIGEPLELDE